MHKYALGTAQFGLDYGINNARGKVPAGEVHQILTRALKAGINTLDTAHGYGDSEEVIGAYPQHQAFKIITKIPDAAPEEINGILERSLKRLKADSVYGVLLHHVGTLDKVVAMIRALDGLKSAGNTQKTGVSLYYPHDLRKILENGVHVDIVQVPYNIFDRRFESDLAALKAKGIEVHVRSVFLQGLMFRDVSQLQGKLAGMRSKIESLQKLAEHSGIPVWALALNFAALNENIHHIILGVDSLAHLEALLRADRFLKGTCDKIEQLKALQEDDEELILPVNWK